MNETYSFGVMLFKKVIKDDPQELEKRKGNSIQGETIESIQKVYHILQILLANIITKMIPYD